MVLLNTKDTPSLLASGITVKGNIVGGHSIEIEGKVEGDIDANIITLRESGNIKGNIKCKVFNISGNFNGNVNAEKINIADTAVVSGVLEYSLLSVDFGATINCELKRITQDQKKIVDILKTGAKNEVINK